MISLVEILFHFMLIYGNLALPPINLDLTESMNKQHDCLHVSAITDSAIRSYQTISYCLTEWPSKWTIKENKLDRKFTFVELSNQHITNEQLYFWSAPMMLMERYQSYLNQGSANSRAIFPTDTDVFYNCTSPRFGPQCQYSLDIYHSHQLSLTQIVREFYAIEYSPTTLTCYVHLECQRGSTFVCLGWHEICDGVVDCLNDAVDEQHCWQLKLNQCQEKEYRCRNGQCIPKAFYRDHYLTLECLDESDQLQEVPFFHIRFNSDEPTFLNEDSQIVEYENSPALGLGSSPSIIKRNRLLKIMKFAQTPMFMSDDCWAAFKCKYKIGQEFDTHCEERQLDRCPDVLLMPAAPILFGHLYLAYRKEDIRNWTHLLAPHYVCYNNRFCQGSPSNQTSLSLHNLTCRTPETFPITFQNNVDLDFYIQHIRQQFYQCNTILYNDSTVCHRSIMYQCLNSSKCIATDQLCDGRNDCTHGDDEQCALIHGRCSVGDSTLLFQCPSAQKCISIYLINDGKCDCRSIYSYLCEDESFAFVSGVNSVPFASICNGYTQMSPLIIDGRNESDESECDYWQCNNTYTRCDRRWNCFDGADEIDCPWTLSTKCPSGHHQCVSPDTFELMCLSLRQANDGQIDCLGATDEPKLCRLTETISAKNFFCKGDPIPSCISSGDLCAEKNRCVHGEDEQLCSSTRNVTGSRSICELAFQSSRSPIQSFFCGRYIDGILHIFNQFSFGDMQYPIESEQSRIIAPPTDNPTRNVDEQRCHRGLPLRVWTDSERQMSTEGCLCPPSYYGETCQYENQRVSLTVRFQAYSDSRKTLFTILVSLIDDENEQRTIYSSQQHTYHYLRDCSMKYNIYLLYPTRPRHPSTNYSIHIDVYEKISLLYRGSFSMPVNFPFLPVNRIAAQLTIPRKSTTIETCSNPSCRHGRCVKYVDEPQGRTFCQCHQGWSGRSCTIPHRCQCSPDAWCVGVSATNQSICVCPRGQWGSRCFLRSDPCQSNQNGSVCLHGGQCVPDDKQLILTDKFICICRKGFSGERCENVDTYLELSFHEEILLPQSIIVHLINVASGGKSGLASNSSVMRTITLYQRSITIYWTQLFHVAFVQLRNEYYLLLVQKQYYQWISYNRTVDPQDRCSHLSEVLNETIVSLHPLRRMKYYQLPCQRFAPTLHCFYDEHYFCLCYDYNGQRLSNCFNFNTKIPQACYGLSDCENDAQCIQDHPTCPQTSICVCSKCFHGRRCQFNSHLFGLSLDAILGYHIQPHINLMQQSRIVKTSLALTAIIAVAGMINAILSFLTFKNRASRESGCGLYLLGSSITIGLTMVVFVVKFSILIYAQMTYLTHNAFLNVQCYTLDFLLRVGLNLDQYLNACVAGERALTVIKATRFSKQKSKRTAKYLLLGLLLWTVGTTIHDPVHRRLLDDNNEEEETEKRIWCIVSYSSNVRIYSSIINSIHFFVPFLLNLLSASVILFMTTRQRHRAQRRHTYQRIFREQFREHIHLLIAPIVLIILCTPRLILSFIADCMQSTSQAWLPLLGYYISFIPSTLTMLTFVFPSNLYTNEFRKSVREIRERIRSFFP